MFNIGDRIVFPMHGAGVIESVEEKEVLGERKKYYIMRIPMDDMKIMVPIDSAVDFGIRCVIDYNEVENVLDIFHKAGSNIEDNWNKRYRYNMDKIRNGNIYGVAQVTGELMAREIKKGLSPGEARILDGAKRILYSELMLVTGLNFEQIDAIIKGRIAQQSVNK